MSKFVIECPECKNFVEVRKFSFTKKSVSCGNGHTFEVNSHTLASRQCPHCKNHVAFNPHKGANAKCPVCHEPINTMAELSTMTEFSCAQCGVRLHTTKNADTYTCPVCDFVNNVAERITSEKIKHDGLASIIKYEGDNSTFIWKHPIEDFNYGSQLIVHESQEAVFFKDGQALDTFGPGRYTLETQQLPALENLYKLPTDTEGTFHSEVYFINKTVQMGIKWGTPEKVRFIDPLTGTPLELGASGEMNVSVVDGRKLLINLVGTMKGISWKTDNLPETVLCEKCGQTLYTINARNGTIQCDNNECGHINRIVTSSGFTKSLQRSFRPLIANAVKTNLPAVIKQNEIDLLEIDEKLDLISASLISKIKPGFEEYGLTIAQFYVNNVVLPENDPNFKRIRELHTIVLQSKVLQAEATVKTVEAQTTAQYRTAQERSKAEIEAARREAVLEQQTTETEITKREAERRVIEAQAKAQEQRVQGLTEAELLKAKGLSEAEVMAAKGYSQKDVIQADVQKAYAEGIGNMGANMGGSSGGSSVVGDIMGLGIGMAAAQAVAPQMGNMFVGLNPNQTTTETTEPAKDAPKGWDCPECGCKNITSRFCPDCGAKKPEPKPSDAWDCPSCGCKNITSKFCPDCGAKKPEPSETWDCPSCGCKNIKSKFCPDCGAKKPAPAETWDCPSCGCKNIKSKFCPKCGTKKPEPPKGWICPDCGAKDIMTKCCPNCGRKKD